MEKESKEKMDKNEKKELKIKEKQEKKEAKLKAKQDKKEKKAENKKDKKLDKTQSKKTNKKVDKFTIFSKVLAAFLVIFTILGTCFTCIYLIVNG